MIFETYFKHVYLYVACLYATSGTGLYAQTLHQHAGTQRDTVPVLRELTPLIRSSNVASELPATRWISEEEIRLLTAPAVIPGRPAVMMTSSRCCTGNVTGTVSL